MMKSNGQLFQAKPDRLRFLMAIWLLVGTLLAVRLVDIQVINGQEYRAKADDNRFFTQSLSAERGVLLDRYGEPLMWNQRSYYQISEDEITSKAKKNTVSREQALQLIASRSARVGYSTERWYRYPQALSQVIGYVGQVSSEDLKNDPTLLMQHQVGKFGLEKSVDEQLRGRDGKEVIEINALGQKQRVIKRVEPVPGQAIMTTIDPQLAEIAWKALGEQRGAVVISDASTGAVLAAVSKPSFDANFLSRIPLDENARKLRGEELARQFQDPAKLFFNRAVAGAYPPGSVFKLVTALAGLAAEKIDRDTTVTDEGSLKVGDYEYGNWYFRQYGRTEGVVNLERALARSNDIYFYKVAEWVGPDALADFARQFGLGKAPGSQLLGEATGLVPDPAWKEQLLGERWYLGNTYHYGIGQGDLLVTPLQINTLIQALANRGVQCTPSFLSAEVGDCRELSLHEDDLELVLLGMLDACSTGGTAFPFFTYNAAHRSPEASAEEALQAGAVACKTGTAEFGGEDSQGHRNTHAWFVAIVEPQLPTSAPSDSEHQKWWDYTQRVGFPERIVITALVESDETQPFKEGSREAGPVVKAIMDWLIQT